MKRLLLSAVFAVALAACTGGTGPLGDKGDKGDPGAAGPAGPNGPAGTAGVNGTNGTNGTNGSNGTNGTNGTNGRSGYNTAAGVKLLITGTTIAADGTVTVNFTVTDPSGVGLDLNGKYTLGVVTTRFVLAWLDPATGQYTAYTTRTRVNPTTDAGYTSAYTDLNGTYTEVGTGQGTYSYVFKTKATVTRPTATHTVAGSAVRAMPDGSRGLDNDQFHFLPAGGAPTNFRNLVTEKTCNRCHNPMQAHGGSRFETAMCITCHQPQSTDWVTGNTVDFKVMVHKLHMGENLPSVLAGGTYAVGDVDATTIALPVDPGNCAVCHAGVGVNDAGVSDGWKTNPSLAACGSCHDDVMFSWSVGDPIPAGKRHHQGGVFDPATGQCTTCHKEGGASPVDVRHTTPDRDPNRKIPVLTIDSITAGPGQYPVITFTVKVNGAPYDVTAPGNAFDRLSFAIAGPTIEYQNRYTYTVQTNGVATDGTPAKVHGTLAPGSSAGQFVFTAASADVGTTIAKATKIPTTATGSYAVGAEGAFYVAGTSNLSNPTLISALAPNPVVYFTVTDPVVVPRRKVVEVARCNLCHVQITTVHGGRRNNPEYCIMCHNPTLFDGASKLPRFNTGTVETFSAASKNFYHGLHMGQKLDTKPFGLFERSANDTEIGPIVKVDGGLKDNYSRLTDGGYQYLNAGIDMTFPVVPMADGGYLTLGANTLQDPSAPMLDYSEIRFPGQQKVCQTCHLKDTFLLPLPATNLGSNEVIVGCLDGQPNPADGGTYSAMTDGGLYCLNQSVTAIVVPPMKAACGGCHNGPVPRTHMDLMTAKPNTAQAVETCEVCHAKGAVVGVDVVHAAPESNPKN